MYGSELIVAPSNGASDDFVALVQYVMDYEMAHNPDPRVPYLLQQVPVYPMRAPALSDFQAAGIMNPTTEILTGLHFGAPPDYTKPESEWFRGHSIYLFEEPMQRRAELEGMTLLQRVDDSLLHELDHVLGACPVGHFDCTIDEIRRTYELGGELNRDQLAVYRGQGLLV